jgi:hypothetical protein
MGAATRLALNVSRVLKSDDNDAIPDSYFPNELVYAGSEHLDDW